MPSCQSERASCLVGLACRVMLTWRFEVLGRERLLNGTDRGYVLAVPHASLLIVAAHHRARGLVTMVSRSQDGDRAAELLVRLGYHVVRGSTSRGAVGALREMARLVPGQRLFGLTVDGPHGPAWRVQPGIVALAAWRGLPIIPVVGNGPGIVWPSWDRLRLPFPGALCRVAVGEPIWVHSRADRMESLAHLEAALGCLRREVGL